MCVASKRAAGRVSGLVLVSLLLALQGAEMLGQGRTNAAASVLGRAVLSAPGEERREIAAQAETLFLRAAAIAPGRRAMWRGLGFALLVQGREDEAVAAWQTAGGMADEFVCWGDQEWAAGRSSDALEWYRRAGAVEPGLRDAWFYLGQVYEELQRWEKALEAYGQAAEANTAGNVHGSVPHYRAGLIYHRRLEPPHLEEALLAYEAAIEVGDFGTAREEADCHYQKGDCIQKVGGDLVESIASHRRALGLNPEHVSAHVSLGAAYYTLYGDAAAAEDEIRKAIAINPETKWAYVRLGNVYRLEGRADEAAAMYERALEIDPAFQIARERLEGLWRDE
jgi:tetratricopeptide (TPR) repeat protein